MIEEKKCEYRECGKKFYGTKRAKFCSDKCRVANWRKKDMFNVDMTQLKQPLKNRGMGYTRNADGTVTVDGKIFDRASDLERYLMAIPRKDIPGA
jgi:hypothetical protein